ncbi:MAG TPA: D-alanine--D-alanine ligase family protein, partial [Thermoanaerobaculia bacterium]|nr:D-alanine--D-alanine ligase family protein [Thermoanaerobaculia bacterium]
MSRQRVVVLFGGRSVEREVSKVSARAIVQALDPAKYEVVPLAVGPDGRFLSATTSAALLSEKNVPEKFLGADETRPARSEAVVPAEISRGRADIVFPIIHGTMGEDGALQGFLDVLGLPYVGAGVTASAVGMDKAVFKALLRDAGLPTPRSFVLCASDRRLKRRQPDLPLPVFVKPSAGGSSVGVTKVKRWEDLPAAIDLAFRYDERILIEEGIDARELECAVLGNDEPKASIVGEIVPGHEFYDYDDKYREDKAKLLIPAPVPETVSNDVQKLAVQAFRLCGISGMARVDFFFERGTKRVLVSELNTLPGFTAISMYPKLWEASGLSLPELL